MSGGCGVRGFRGVGFRTSGIDFSSSGRAVGWFVNCRWRLAVLGLGQEPSSTGDW